MLKMKSITNVLVAALLLCLSPAYGQIVTTIAPQTFTGTVNSTIDLQLQVTNFTNVLTFQCPITYTSTVLEYVSTTGYGLPGMTAGNIGVPTSGTKRITISYQADPIAYPNGATVANGTSIVTMKFKIIANGTANVNLATGVSPVIEVINSSGNNVTVNFQNGGATVTGGSGGPPPQVGLKFMATPDTVSTNELFCMPVKVNDFDKMILFQYAMHWDPTVLQYQSVSGFNLPDLSASNFSGNTAAGTLTCAWYDNSPTLAGVDRADGATIYNVCFKALGANNTSTNITFDGVGFPPGSGGAEAYSALSPNNLWVSTTPVSATILVKNTTPVLPIPNISVDTATAVAGGSKCIDVRVKNFVDVASMQFGLSYDATKLQYQSVSLGSNPLGLTAASVTNPTAGEVRFTWNANLTTNPDGVDLSDNTSIFSVCFVAVGAVGTTNKVEVKPFASFPIKVQQRVSGVSVDVVPTTQNGHIYIKAAPPANAMTFTIDTAAVVMGANPTCLAVKVKNFTNVESLQFGITYDPTKLQWVTPTFGANTLGLTASMFNNNASTGQVKFTWSNADPISNPNGFTLADGSAVFSACFNVIGAPVTTVPVQIVPLTGLPIEIYQVINGASTQAVPVVENGYIRIINIVPPSVTVDSTRNTKCFGSADGAVYVTIRNGTATGFSWSGPNGFTSNQADLTNGVRAGTYTITVTFNGGATATAWATITQPTALSLPTVTPTPVTCFQGTDGAISIVTAGGTGTHTYLWTGPAPFTSTQQNISNLRAGNYTVTVTDANACTLVSGAILVSGPQAVTFPTASLTVSPVSCFDGSNGVISLTAQGGTPFAAPSSAYTYNWSGPNGFTSSSAPPLSGLRTGLYNVTATDSRGCSGVMSSPIQVSAPTSAPTPSVTSSTNVKCLNDENGTATISVIGGTSPYSSYSWRNTLNNQVVSGVQNPTNLAAGNYICIVTDNNGCTAATPPVAIAKPSSALTASLVSKTDVVCNGANTGAISLNISGGWGTPTVNWTSSLNGGASISGLAAGSYSPTITDAGGCVVSTPAIVVNGPANGLALTNTTVTHIKCKGQGDGCITIQVSGGTQPYNVQWTPGGLAGTTICQLEAATYTPTITDNNGCTLVPVGIPVNQPAGTLSINNSDIINQSGSALGSITLDVVGGVAPYRYQWGHLGSIITTNIVTGLAAGNYQVTVIDANDCLTTNSYVVVNENVLTANYISQTLSCGSADACVRIYFPPASVFNKPYTITWNNNSGSYLEPNTNLDTISVCGLAGGAYTFTVKDALGNTFNLLNTVFIQTAQPINYSSKINNPNEDFANGSISIIPSNPAAQYTYQWDYQALNNDTISTLDSGRYCVTITDLNTTCRTSECFNLARVWQPIQSIEQLQQPTCNGLANGKITLVVGGGNPPFQFNWSGPSITATDTSSVADNLEKGAYSVTISDENGTTQVKNFTLQSQSNLAATSTTTPGPNGFDVSGANICDGQVQITATGFVAPAVYTWNNGVTTANNTSLCAGDWSVVVTDAAGCTANLSGVLSSPAAIAISSSCVDKNGYCISCNGGNDGAAKVSALGGIAPYQVKWSTGFSQTLNSVGEESLQAGLKAGDYTVTITDANGISVTKIVQVTEPAPLGIEFNNIPATKFTDCDAEIFATATGGSGAAVTFTWSSKAGSGTGANVSNLCSGEAVQFLARDANGCIATANDTVAYPEDGCLIFRPVITPGNDEKNDFLLVTCVESVPGNTLEIYNRWGQLVFETVGYNNDDKSWKGTNSRGAELPEGVYFYVFTYPNSLGETIQKKGYINLLR